MRLRTWALLMSGAALGLVGCSDETCRLSLEPRSGSVGSETELTACVTCQKDHSEDESSPDDDRVTFSGCAADCSLNPERGRTGSDGCVRTILANENDREEKAFVTIEALSDTGAFESGNYELPPPTPTPLPDVPVP